MKRYVHADSEAYNYGSQYVIAFVKDQGWVIYDHGRIVGGPFYSWLEAQEFVDSNLD